MSSSYVIEPPYSMVTLIILINTVLNTHLPISCISNSCTLKFSDARMICWACFVFPFVVLFWSQVFQGISWFCFCWHGLEYNNFLLQVSLYLDKFSGVCQPVLHDCKLTFLQILCDHDLFVEMPGRDPSDRYFTALFQTWSFPPFPCSIWTIGPMCQRVYDYKIEPLALQDQRHFEYKVLRICHGYLRTTPILIGVYSCHANHSRPRLHASSITSNPCILEEVCSSCSVLSFGG